MSAEPLAQLTTTPANPASTKLKQVEFFTASSARELSLFSTGRRRKSKAERVRSGAPAHFE
jgi:hypothetical protein